MDTDGIIHITDLAELTEEDLRAMDELLGDSLIDDGNGFWRIEDRDGNTIGTGCTTERKK